MRLNPLFHVSFVISIASFAAASGGNRVLVLLDNLALKESHSIFFKTLGDLGLDLSFKVRRISENNQQGSGQTFFDPS